MKKIINKWNNLSVGVKASFAFFFASIVTSGIAYLTTPIYTRLLSSQEYGQISLFFTWMEIFGIIAMFCLSNGVFNNGMLDYKDDRDIYSYSMLILSNLITIFFAVVLLVLYPLIKEFINIDIPLLILMFFVFFTQPAYNFWTSRQRFEYKYKKTVIATIISAIISPIMSVICIFHFSNNKVYGRLFGAELALVFFYLIFYFYLAIKSKFKIKTKYWKFAICFNLPLIPHYISTYLLSNSDRVMIGSMVGESAIAFYSVAYSVGSVVMIIWTAANASLIPYIYEKCEKKDYKSISIVTLPILTLFAVFCFLLILLAPEVVSIMATNEYREAIYVIPPIVGGVFFQVHYFMYANILYYYRKPMFVMVGSLIATLLNIGLNFIFIPPYGYIAAGYTTLVCYLIQATIDYIAMRQTVGCSIYNMKWIGILSLLIILISLFSSLIYSYRIVRYCIVIAICIFAVVFRKKIIGMFKILKGNNNDET